MPLDINGQNGSVAICISKQNLRLGRKDSNLRMLESKSSGLPLADAPTIQLPNTQEFVGVQHIKNLGSVNK
jgi:hypothetical protein